MLRAISWLMVMGLAFSGSATASGLADWANDAGTGVFLMRTSPGQPLVPATLLKTDVDIEVSGPIAHVTVRQSFFNQGGEHAEALYVFPLPEQSAVHGMQLVVGQRRIVGRIEERAEAKRVYEKARREGKRTALVEQVRPNVFTTAVANIASGERVGVVIEYTQQLTVDGNRFSLRFPMTLTPRYRPAPGTGSYHELDLGPHGAVTAGKRLETQRASAEPVDVSGPVAAPNALSERVNRARIEVLVAAGRPLAVLESSSHDIRTVSTGMGYRVSLAQADVPMDRDFLLSWRPTGGTEARAAFFSEVVAGEHYGLLMLMPPRQLAVRRLAREVVFVIDTSGSMGGASIRQARAALLAALDRLNSDDRFNVVEFDSGFSTLFAETVPADRARLSDARHFVAQLEAGGGTEMLPALAAALTMPGDPEHLRQVVFITDGAVGNERAVFALLHQRLGDTRLFTVGIGSAPNSYFMRKGAELGRGTFTYISDAGQVRERMSALFRKLESPVLRDIEITLPPDVHAELWPSRVPDLYAGEPVLVAMKLSRVPQQIVVSGMRPAHWQAAVPAAGNGGHEGIATVWAREKIEALMDRIIRGEPESAVRPEIVQVALTHDLVSRYTGFVAVDETPTRRAGSTLATQVLPNLSPYGFAFPQTALGLNRLYLHGALCLLAALLIRVTKRRRRRA